jgi:hypothetical protein
MEDIEVPTEHLNEEINEHANTRNKWSMYIAISTAFMAVLAAIAGLMAGHFSNEALIEQIKASDEWAYYQAKGIKADIIASSNMRDSSKITKYKSDQIQIEKTAREFEKNSATFLEKHVILARAVTLFQIAIAISAISILTGKRSLWYLGILLSLTGIYFFLTGYL